MSSHILPFFRVIGKKPESELILTLHEHVFTSRWLQQHVALANPVANFQYGFLY